MDDENIVRLYWDRDEAAISESSEKYGPYCTSIALNILNNMADAEECVNDTWLHAWKAMPPHRPSVLSAFFGKITRNLSFDLYRRQRREKRGGANMDLALDELNECVSGADDTQRRWEAGELQRELERFLIGLPVEKRSMFILRYWYVYSIRETADRMGMTETKVSVTLHRIRRDLKGYLIERGFDV